MHRTVKDIPVGKPPPPRKDRAESADVIAFVLDSGPVRALRFVLDRAGLQIEPRPIVNKDLSDSLVRLMFPVTGGPIQDGTVVSVVCLFDRSVHRTLYAHPMHAGPNVNPLVRHLDGPMATPKAQPGADGDRASRRIIEHKRALWDRFLQELPRLGEREAGRRWRDNYYWSLKRLYFCSGCTQCKWGTPFFDGPDPTMPHRAIVSRKEDAAPRLGERYAALVADIISSDAWRVEQAYVQRGGFVAIKQPRLLKALDDEFVQAVFPTNASLIQAGAPVAVAFTYHFPSRSAVLSHCLCAGPEPEIQFLRGELAFGLPQPQPGKAGEDARIAYRTWRLSAWSNFWHNELEDGLAIASETWLEEFWNALEALFGGNDVSRSVRRRHWGSSPDTSQPTIAGHGDLVLPVQALENMGGRCFAGHTTAHGPTKLRALGLSTLMVNLGRRCNQACHHCHVDAGPHRTEEMSRETMDLVLEVLRRHAIETLDITGGAPELNPHFRYLARAAARSGTRVVDRCNLTVFFEPGYEDLPEFLAKHGIQVTASLPSEQADVVDRQRGIGTFDKSVRALRKLNELGYARPGTGLTLNLVYNPAGTDVGASQEELEQLYKDELAIRFGIVFDRLLAMNNMPINRFQDYLRREGNLSAYMNSLVRMFNPDTVDHLMCRRTISVGYDGRLYNCDFHQAMDIPLSAGLPGHIRDFDALLLKSRDINTRGHCFGCTAGAGSSCNGALTLNSIRIRAGDDGIGGAPKGRSRETTV